MSEKLLGYLYSIIGWLGGFLPFFLLQKIGTIVGYSMVYLDKDRWNVTLDNISNSLECTTDQAKTIAYGSYSNLGITLIESAAMHYKTDAQILQQVDLIGIELLSEKHSLGNGIIVLSAHFGNWELGSYALGCSTDIPMTIVGKKQKNTDIDTKVNTLRKRNGSTVVYMDKAARSLFTTLKNNGIVAILADQAADPKTDIFIDFFKRPAVTFEAPATLALKTGAAILYCYGVRQKNGRYTIQLLELFIDDLRSVHQPSARRQIMERYTKTLENIIIQFPDLWSWQHKRWKYNPNDYHKNI